MKRFILTLFAVLTLLVPLTATAQEMSGLGASGVRLYPTQLKFHNTTAASSVARQPAWSASSGYTDSLVFRKAAAAPTSYDTTQSFPMSRFPLPPNWGPGTAPSIADTLMPWFFIKFSQDTTSYSGSSIITAMDSVRVWAEFSDDNVNWFSAPGTPTYRFDVVFATTGADGLVSPTLIGVERLPGIDGATVPFKTRFTLGADGATNLILNAPYAGQWQYIRFLFGGDYVGQFKADLLYWSTSQSIGN